MSWLQNDRCSGCRSRPAHSGSHRRRRAATLVCVLIVLMLVGLLSAQAVQMMVSIRQADVRRSNLIQARELVELGRVVAEDDSKEQLKEREFEMSFSRGDRATVTVTKESETSTSEKTRVVVQYLVRGKQEVMATWQSSMEEVVK
ncbi:MAG: type II secretion system protein [Planctomycetota bacterium]